jgi:hypothetical protein
VERNAWIGCCPTSALIERAPTRTTRQPGLTWRARHPPADDFISFALMGVFEMALTSVELTPLLYCRLELGCLATSTILNCGSHDPPLMHKFLFFPAQCPRSPPSCLRARAPPTADSAAHAASPSPSAASGASSSDGCSALAPWRETSEVEEADAGLLGSAKP